MKVNTFEPVDYPNKTSERLDVLLAELNLRVPESYREFLTDYNGGRPKSQWFFVPDLGVWSKVHHMYGLHDGPDFKRLDKAQEKNVHEPHSILIADDPIGNQIALSANESTFGEVHYCDRLTSGIYKIEDNFTNFLSCLLPENPVDENTLFERIAKADNVEAAEAFISEFGIECLDDLGRSLLENAVIQNSKKLVCFLLEEGAEVRSAKQLAEKNARYFPEFGEMVDLLMKA